MRYKASFKPSYILGRSRSHKLVTSPDLLGSDPWTYEWHRMDSDLLQRMSARKYLSMTLECMYHLPVDPGRFVQSELRTGFDFSPELALGPETFGFLLDYAIHPDDAREPIKACSSAFEAGMPGIIPLKEMKEVDLGCWKLKVADIEANLWVRQEKMHPSVSDMADDSARCSGPRSLGNRSYRKFAHDQRPRSGASSLYRARANQANKNCILSSLTRTRGGAIHVKEIFVV